MKLISIRRNVIVINTGKFISMDFSTHEQANKMRITICAALIFWAHICLANQRCFFQQNTEDDPRNGKHNLPNKIKNVVLITSDVHWDWIFDKTNDFTFTIVTESFICSNKIKNSNRNFAEIFPNQKGNNFVFSIHTKLCNESVEKCAKWMKVYEILELGCAEMVENNKKGIANHLVFYN